MSGSFDARLRDTAVDQYREFGVDLALDPGIGGFIRITLELRHEGIHLIRSIGEGRLAICLGEQRVVAGLQCVHGVPGGGGSIVDAGRGTWAPRLRSDLGASARIGA